MFRGFILSAEVPEMQFGVASLRSYVSRGSLADRKAGIIGKTGKIQAKTQSKKAADRKCVNREVCPSETKEYLIVINLENNADFERMLGYINTQTDEQKKEVI